MTGDGACGNGRSDCRAALYKLSDVGLAGKLSPAGMVGRVRPSSLWPRLCPKELECMLEGDEAPVLMRLLNSYAPEELE